MSGSSSGMRSITKITLSLEKKLIHDISQSNKKSKAEGLKKSSADVFYGVE